MASEKSIRNFSISLPTALVDALDKLATSEGSTRSSIIRRACTFYLENSNPAPKLRVPVRVDLSALYFGPGREKPKPRLIIPPAVELRGDE